jgi:membrane-bound metal-dependent hydrolase YbcI (DUF457 family)
MESTPYTANDPSGATATYGDPLNLQQVGRCNGLPREIRRPKQSAAEEDPEEMAHACDYSIRLGSGRRVVMFIGHFAVGLASKKLAPRAPLSVLLAAPLLLDLLWPLFLLAGWESVRIIPGGNPFLHLQFVSYPISHSLAAALLWAAIFGGVYWWRRGDRTAGWVLFGGVVSHWVLDAASHVPDMALWPGSPKVGLGLWNSVPGTVIVEVLMFLAGVWIYRGVTRPRDRVGAYAFWAFVVFLLVMYAANLLGPPPPDERSLAWFSLGLWLFPPWAGWFDRHRVVDHY